MDVERLTVFFMVTSSVLMPILLRAKVSFEFHRLAALRANGPPAAGDLRAPARYAADLRACTPETHHRSLIGIGILLQDFAHQQYYQIVLGIVAQADLTCAEERVHRRGNMHFSLIIIRFCLRQVRTTADDLGQQLLHADGQRLQLNLLNEDRHWLGLVSLPALDVKGTLAGLADGVSGDMRNRVEIKFEAGHGVTSEK